MDALAFALNELCRVNRDGSCATQANRTRMLQAIAAELKAGGYKLPGAGSLKPRTRHVHRRRTRTGPRGKEPAIARARPWADRRDKGLPWMSQFRRLAVGKLRQTTLEAWMIRCGFDYRWYEVVKRTGSDELASCAELIIEWEKAARDEIVEALRGHPHVTLRRGPSSYWPTSSPLDVAGPLWALSEPVSASGGEFQSCVSRSRSAAIRCRLAHG